MFVTVLILRVSFMNKENKYKSDSISDSLAMTVAKGNLELPAEIAEFTIDQIIDDGMLKDIPVVGWIAKGLSISNSISDRIFYHKILRFVMSLEKTDESERTNFIENIANNKEFKKRVGEHLLMLLDKIDSVDKATLTAKCFNYFLRNKIDHDYFMDLSSVISRSTISDLNSLCVPTNKRVSFRNITIAASTGILDYGIYNNDDNAPEIGHRLSDLGSDLRDILLGREPSKFNDNVEMKKRHEERLENIRKDHILNAEKAREMKNKNMSDEDIIENLSITEHLLTKYLSTDSA